MLKACHFTSHENVRSRYYSTCVLERQSDIWLQHLKVLSCLIPVYSLTLCDAPGYNRGNGKNPTDLMLCSFGLKYVPEHIWFHQAAFNFDIAY